MGGRRVEHKLGSDRVKLAGRMERLGTETAFSVLAKAKALEARGRDIIHLEIGEPDFDTPAHVVEAGCRALRAGHTHYTPTAGIRSCAPPSPPTSGAAEA
jgi:L-ascorbate metabolism protein UlaG (beta-lactamase superfamily)